MGGEDASRGRRPGRRAVAAPMTPGSASAENCRCSMASRFAARTLAIRVQPPHATARWCGPTMRVDGGEQGAGLAGGVSGGGRPDVRRRDVVASVRTTTSSPVGPAPETSSPREAPRPRARPGRARRRSGSLEAPSAPRTRRSSRPPRTPPSSSVVPGRTCAPRSKPDRTSSSRRSSSSTPGRERATTSAVPEELNSSSGPTAPTPIAATGWSWPATVRAAPCDRRRQTRVAAARPRGLPATTAGGSSVAGRPAAATPVGPDRAGGLVDEPGPRRQRRLADQSTRRAGARPTRGRSPSGAPAVSPDRALQPEQLGQAGLAVPRQAGPSGELLGQLRDPRARSGRSAVPRACRTRRPPGARLAGARRAGRRSRRGRRPRHRGRARGPTCGSAAPTARRQQVDREVEQRAAGVSVAPVDGRPRRLGRRPAPPAGPDRSAATPSRWSCRGRARPRPRWTTRHGRSSPDPRCDERDRHMDGRRRAGRARRSFGSAGPSRPGPPARRSGRRRSPPGPERRPSRSRRTRPARCRCARARAGPGRHRASTGSSPLKTAVGSVPTEQLAGHRPRQPAAVGQSACTSRSAAGESVLRHRLAVAGQAGRGRRHVRVVADVGDVAVPVRDQVGRRVVGRPLVVDADDVGLESRRRLGRRARAGSPSRPATSGHRRSARAAGPRPAAAAARSTTRASRSGVAVRGGDEDRLALRRRLPTRRRRPARRRTGRRWTRRPARWSRRCRLAASGPSGPACSCSSSITARTRARVSAATRGSSLRTREAVRRLTPAASATSRKRLLVTSRPPPRHVHAIDGKAMPSMAWTEGPTRKSLRAD